MTMQTWHLEQLKTASTLPVEEGVVVWLPSENVSVHQIPRPSAPRRKWSALLPWLVEERLLDAPEKLHLTLLDVQQDSLQVLAVSRSVLDEALAFTDRIGLRVRAMLPDYLALPWQPGEVTVAWRFTDLGRVLVTRTGQLEGFAAPESLATALLRKVMGEEAVRIRALMPREALPAFLQNPDVICDEAPDWHTPATDRVNMLHGAYDRSEQAGKGAGPRWATAALVMLALLLAWTWLGMGNRALEARVALLEDSRQQALGRAFPGIRLANDDVRGSLESALRDRFLQREKLQEPLPALLLALDPVLAACDCRLQSLSLQGGAGTLEFSGQVPAAAFSSMPGVIATVASSDEGSTRLTLRAGQ